MLYLTMARVSEYVMKSLRRNLIWSISNREGAALITHTGYVKHLCALLSCHDADESLSQ